jgi:hypothetical protein
MKAFADFEEVLQLAPPEQESAGSPVKSSSAPGSSDPR